MGLDLDVKVNTEGIKDLVRRADEAFGEGKGERKVWNTVANQAVAWMKRTFDRRMKGERVDGVGWRPVSGVTALFRTKSKVKKLEDLKDLPEKVKPLADTGVLRNSIAGGGPQAIKKVSGHGVVVGTSVPYAELHQDGGTSSLKFRQQSDGDLKLDSRRGRQGSNQLLSSHISMKGRARKKKRGEGMTKGWNPEFFRLREALKKMQGSKSVPRRPVLTDPPDNVVREWFATVEEAIMVKFIGNSGRR